MKTSLHHAHLFATDVQQSLRFYQEMFGAEIIFDEKMAGARNIMISIGAGKINFYDKRPPASGPSAVHHLGIETDDLEALVDHMRSKGYVFRTPIRNFGAWKYIMAEGSCQGTPAIRRGTVVEVEEVGNLLSGNYYVSRVNHTLLPGKGYTTSFDAIKTAIKKEKPPKQIQRQQPQQQSTFVKFQLKDTAGNTVPVQNAMIQYPGKDPVPASI